MNATGCLDKAAIMPVAVPLLTVNRKRTATTKKQEQHLLELDPRPSCNDCRHYYITWDPKFPFGCKAMKFKSAREPQLDVVESSGQECLYFERKMRAQSRLKADS